MEITQLVIQGSEIKSPIHFPKSSLPSSWNSVSLIPLRRNVVRFFFEVDPDASASLHYDFAAVFSEVDSRECYLI